MADPPRGNGGVLVIDTELMFAQVVELALTRHGYAASVVDLSVTADPERLLRQMLAGPTDVLLLDLGLDLGRHGDGVAVISWAVRAGVPVVVVKGSDSREDRARALEAGARRMLTKTSSLADLLDTVEQLLSEEQSLPAGT